MFLPLYKVQGPNNETRKQLMKLKNRAIIKQSYRNYVKAVSPVSCGSHLSTARNKDISCLRLDKSSTCYHYQSLCRILRWKKNG